MPEFIAFSKFSARSPNELRCLLMTNRTHINIFTWNILKRLVILISMLSTIILVALPQPVVADGGPMVDPLLFARLKEGQQIAVIKIKDVNTASIDLFISILDQTGETHEIVFFVPLGAKATGFSVQERDSYSFNNSLTGGLDAVLFQNFLENRKYVSSLFAGALLTNGVWLTPLWLPFLLTGCASPPLPESTYKTDSSEVNVYGLDETTDIDALVSTSGLDPKVTETLSRLKGQQIAVVKLRTNARGEDTPSDDTTTSTGEPGLHLSWVSSLVQTESGASYAYPLGTGSAWAHPIELTRVYIVAPSNLDLNVQYPEMGLDRSGYTRDWYSNYKPRIADYSTSQAYAVDTSIEQNLAGYMAYRYSSYKGLGRVWRITYTNSNATEDILIKVNPRSGLNLGIGLRNAGPPVALLIGLIIAALFWITTWYFLMPRLLSRDHRDKELWRFSLSYIRWNVALFFPGAILLLLFLYGSQAMALGVAAVLFSGVSLLIFGFSHLHKLGVSTGQAIKAFTIVTLVSNGAYLLFVIAYARLINAI